MFSISIFVDLRQASRTTIGILTRPPKITDTGVAANTSAVSFSEFGLMPD